VSTDPPAEGFSKGVFSTGCVGNEIPLTEEMHMLRSSFFLRLALLAAFLLAAGAGTKWGH
jgi:hypothetical protein